MDVPLLWPILLQIVLIGLNAVFACAEIAVLSVSEPKLKLMAAEGDKRARRLLNLTEVPAKFLATIQVAITLSGFLGSAFAADNFAELLVGGLAKIGVILPRSVAVVLITVILSYFTLVFGELVPKRLAMKKTEPIALALSGLLSFVAKAFRPLVYLLTVSTNGVMRLFGISPEQDEEEVTEEEIRMMVNAGSESGSIDREEQQLIQNVFEFNDIQIGEICTHRISTDVLWLEEDKAASIAGWAAVIHDTRRSNYPVCGESIDDIIGILSAKDYFRLQSESADPETILSEALHPAVFVPATLSADVLFRNMRASGNYFAVVLDEYGGMDGVISLRDLVEQLVGELNEEDDQPDETERLEKQPDGSFLIGGMVLLDRAAEKLSVKLPIEEYDTFSGYLIGLLGYIPADGSSVSLETDDLLIETVEVREHRVEKAKVQRRKKDA